MKFFQATLRVLPADTQATQTIQVEGEPYQTCNVETSQFSEPFPVTFEEVMDKMNRWPRMQCEPDGFFVWTGDDPEPWQLEGNLFDRNDQLLFVEMKGNPPIPMLDQLLKSVGWPDIPLLFELAVLGAYLDESNFRKYLAS